MNINIKISQIVTFLIFLWTGMVSAQEKRKVTEEDYKLWHSIKVGVSSSDGKWTSYSKFYENNLDTLFLKNIDTDKEYYFPNSNLEQITNNGEWFAFINSGNLNVLNLNSGAIEIYFNVSGFKLLNDNKHLIFSTKQGSEYDLVILNLYTNELNRLNRVLEYKIDTTHRKIAIFQIQNGTICTVIVNLDNFKIQTIREGKPNDKFEGLTWNKNSNALGYLCLNSKTNEFSIELIRNTKKLYRIHELKSGTLLDKEKKILKSNFFISDDGEKVFFDTSKTNQIESNKPNPEIWKSTDNEFPPTSRIKLTTWNVWLVEKNQVMEVDTEIFKLGELMDNQQKVILIDNNVYLPVIKFDDKYSDVYLLDLDTGIIEKILEKQIRFFNHINPQKNGHYIAYFKDNQWWSYDSKKKNHYCVTRNLKSSFNKANSDRQDKHRAYGFGGWTTNGEMLVYDEFDIWLISADGKKHKRLTEGRIKQVKHQLKTYHSDIIHRDFAGYTSQMFNLNDGLLIKTINLNNLNEGIGIWNYSGGYKQLFENQSKILFFDKINSDTFQYIDCKYDLPPQIKNLRLDGDEKVIAKSNEHQNKFYWGKSELIDFQGHKGNMLKGVLIYPANYNKNNSYPMVVSIYEKQSNELNEYIPPNYKNFTGFNITNFSQEGYFVLLPDIEYELNQVGESALYCVNAAIEMALNIASIDENKVGLIGHSFGGFEVSYIVSQTNRFKAAISSGGVNDLLSYYLDIDSFQLSNMERFEIAHFRNKIPFIDLKFHKESPIMNVSNIKTPLMIWVGLEDISVDPKHSIKLFAALWRLGKESIFIRYPDEGHVIIKEENQYDISKKTIEWFNYHLKNLPPGKWMK